MRLLDEGKSTAEIFIQIEADYARFGPPTTRNIMRKWIMLIAAGLQKRRPLTGRLAVSLHNSQYGFNPQA